MAIIRDRDGHVLATSKRDANGEPYRVYPSKAVAPLVGYASRLYGTAGLERAYDSELTGILRRTRSTSSCRSSRPSATGRRT